jgi:hypothetical protein
MTTLAGNGTADLEFCDLALLPASGIVECFHAAGIDVSVAGGIEAGVAPGGTAGSIDPALE